MFNPHPLPLQIPYNLSLPCYRKLSPGLRQAPTNRGFQHIIHLNLRFHVNPNLGSLPRTPLMCPPRLAAEPHPGEEGGGKQRESWGLNFLTVALGSPVGRLCVIWGQ